jgi:hypothetical protein
LHVSPFTYYVSRLCDEFPGRLPTEIFAERDRLPVGFLEEVIASRHFARAVATYQQNPAARSGLIDLVREFDFELGQIAVDDATNTHE